MTLKVTQGHPNCRYLIGHTYHLLLVVCNNDSILHHFRDTTTFGVQMTACEITRHVCFPIHV